MAVHSCPNCPLKFPTKQQLLQHLSRKTPCNAGGHKCRNCGKGLKTAKTLRRHEKICQGNSVSIEDVQAQLDEVKAEHESSMSTLQNALQSVQSHRDALVIATDLPKAQAALANLQHIPLVHMQPPPDVDAKGRLILQSLIGTDFVKSQVYFGIPGTIPTLQDADGAAIDVSSMEQFQVLKIGHKEQEEHDRFGDHSREMGGFQVLDSMLTRFPATLERQLLRYLRSEKLLVRAKFPEKRGIDKECAIIRSHKEYADMIAFVKEMAASIDSQTTVVDVLRSELELLKGQNAAKDAEARIIEAEARKLEAEARKLEAEAAVKKADLEMLKHQQMHQ